MTRNEKARTRAVRTRTQTRMSSGERSAAAPAAQNLLYAAILSAVIALGIGIGCLFLLCAVCIMLDDPCAIAPVLARIALLPASIAAGVLAAKKSRAGGIPSGALAGVFLVVLLFGIGIVCPTDAVNTYPMYVELIITAVCILLSCVGGYAVTHKKPRVRRKRG